MMTGSTDVPVCIDGRLLEDGGAGTGIGQYARTLVQALRSAGRAQLILGDGGRAARRSRPAKWAAALRPWPRGATITPGGYRARDIFREAHVFFSLHGRIMPLRLPGPSGIMHWSYPLPMRICGWRNIYTVHDVMPLDPDIPTPVDGRRLRAVLDGLVASGGSFVTVSNAARQAIVDATGWPPGKVAICHQGVDIGDMEAGRRAALPAGLQAGGYLLYVGAVEARKNLVALLDAYRTSGIATPLVISGPDGLNAEHIDARIQDTPGAIRLGLQPRDAVLGLIASARALILVSLAEGFGVPVAEAMSLGTAVLSADIPALAEVGGGATLLVDPRDPAALRHGLTAIDGDAALREKLVRAGLERSQYFGLESYAQRLANLYGMA
ncbi:glycosyltransferase family 4 protein [Sphingobium sp. TCM1]|jgi:glycosyltransferase involved in cell wall biosynthesis|uniref:glycosyltransferase family 4 protein n=1 Tax=Sphingobium sp. TCM1 TaxID=453246 RepID=UPI0007F4AC5A|nr:glycosyltransferase family 1 protein [Sphingobium sp. TCM1]OAN55675.1 hypothetical protein A7Q26_20380 [Sphingobium sp. TCM1]